MFTDESKFKEAESFYLRKLSPYIGLKYYMGCLYGVVNHQIISLRFRGYSYELAIWVGDASKFELEQLMARLRRDLGFFSNVRLKKRYLKVKIFSFHLRKKRVGESLKKSIDLITKQVQRFHHVDVTDDSIAFYDGYPALGHSSYYDLLQEERDKLLNNTKGNIVHSFLLTLLNNGPVVVLLSVLLGLIRLNFKFSILPLDTMLLLLAFNVSLIERLNKVDFWAQIVNGISALFILLIHIYIEVSIVTYAEKGELIEVEALFSILDKNLREFNVGIIMSLIVVFMLIIGTRRTNKTIDFQKP